MRGNFITRRDAIAATIGGLAAPVVLTSRVRASTPVKVGMVQTMSGPFASSGDIIVKAAQLFLRTEAPALLGGRPVELVIRDDTGANPETARRLVQELITREAVSFVSGLQWTPNANAVAPLLTQARVPGVIMNATGAATTRLSPFLVRFSLSSWHPNYPLGVWAAKMGYKNAYVMVTDFAPGHDAQAAFTKGFADNGGSIVQAVRIPIQNPNFIPFFQRAADARPDVIFAFNPGGAQATSFIKAYAELGLQARGVKLMGSGYLTSEEELPNMGETASGVITAFHWSGASERPENLKFLERWRTAYGDLRPNDLAINAWDAMHGICAAIASHQDAAIDGERAMQSLRRFSSNASPRGSFFIDPETRDIVQNIYIREVRPVNGRPANVEIDTIPEVRDPWKLFNPA